MKIPLTYGVLIAIVNTVILFALFFLGYHSDADKLASLGPWPSLAFPVILLLGMILAVRARRAEVPQDQAFGYGSAAGTAILTGIISAIIGALLFYIYLQFINPGFADVQMQVQNAKMAAKNLNAQQIEGGRKIAAFIFKPLIQGVLAAVFSTILSVILRLIIAAFFRRDAGRSVVAVPPPIA